MNEKIDNNSKVQDAGSCVSIEEPAPPPPPLAHRRFYVHRLLLCVVLCVVLVGHFFVVERNMLFTSDKNLLKQRSDVLKLTKNNITQVQKNDSSTVNGTESNSTNFGSTVKVQKPSTSTNATNFDSTVKVQKPSTTSTVLTTPILLDLLPWELQSIRQSTNVSDGQHGFKLVPVCKPPNGIPDPCCLGSVSTRMGMKRADVCFRGDDTYNKVANASLKELQKSEALADQDECDACRIIELVHQHNLTFVITGDSMMLQTFSGFWCELSRRGYVVKENTTYHTYSAIFVGIRGSTVLEISGPAHWDKPITVKYISQYAPKPGMAEMADIASTADVLLMNFGLHWTWVYRDKYRANMASVFNTTKHGNLKLLAFRETSAQHFDGEVGDYYRKAKRYPCHPLSSNSSQSKQYRWRERVVADTATKSGYKVVVADESLPKVERSGEGEKELIILPFKKFTSQLHDMHPDECTHYCSTPFLWMPIWRSLRLAMDRQWSNKSTG